MYIWSVYLVLLPSVFAFLLEPINPKYSTGGYLTISRFLEAQKQQHIETEALRTTTDDTIAVLTSQLQSKFADLEKKLIGDVKKNETCRAVGELEREIFELKINQTNMLSELKIAKEDNKRMKDTLSMLINETHHVDERVKNIEQLTNIQSLQDLQTIKQQIQRINMQTTSLSQNQFARNQDFLAFYNQTSFSFVQTNKRLQHLESFQNVSLTNLTMIQHHVTDRFVAAEDRLQHLEEYKNMSLTRLNTNTAALQTQITNNKRKVEDQLQHLEEYKNMSLTRLNTNTAALQTQITNNKPKVVITACQIGNVKQALGYIVKFDNVTTSIGLSDILSFTSGGKFKCEFEGTYIVSVTLTAYNSLINYWIYLNGNIYTSVYENDNSGRYQTDTTTVLVNLHRNDMLWVQLKGSMYVDERNSCISIVIIK